MICICGFILEEKIADHDADPSTTEGLFIFNGNAPPLDVEEGQSVCVAAPVSEFFSMTQVSATVAGSVALIARRCQAGHGSHERIRELAIQRRHARCAA